MGKIKRNFVVIFRENKKKKVDFKIQTEKYLAIYNLCPMTQVEKIRSGEIFDISSII